MNYDSLFELFKNRRSTRKFKSDQIPDEYVDQIIEAARWAPSAANSQPWEFVVVKKPELKTRIIEFLEEANDSVRKVEAVREPELRFKWAAAGYARAPIFIILAGDPRTKEAYPLNTMLVRGSSHFTTSMAICFLYMTLAAESLGLGAQWVSAIAYPYVQTLTKELLHIPQELEFYDMLAMGFSDLQPRPRLMREKQEMVHYDYYDKTKFRTDQQIKDFITQLRK
jgi:5,6-dimethylbenzimidazole synthase